MVGLFFIIEEMECRYRGILMKHGWDKYRKEGVEELNRLSRTNFFANKDAQLKLLNRYAEIYQQGEEHTINANALYSKEHCMPKDKIPGNAHQNTKSLRKSLVQYYYSKEGSVSAWELYFIADKGDYRLGIKPRVQTDAQADAEVEAEKKLPKEISFLGHPYFEIKSSPVLLFVVPLGILGIILLSIITGKIFVESRIMLALLVAIEVVLAFISWRLYRLPEKKFTHFFHKYFLQLADDRLILATYSSTCNDCDGDVELTSTYVKDTGYIARCQENPHSHSFTFDHTSLNGERL